MNTTIKKANPNLLNFAGVLCTICQVVVILSAITLLIQTIVAIFMLGFQTIANPPRVFIFFLITVLALSVNFNMKNEQVLSNKITWKITLQWLTLTAFSVAMLFL